MMTRRALAGMCAVAIVRAGVHIGGQGTSVPPNPTREQVVQMMKEISNWGRWGKDDELMKGVKWLEPGTPVTIADLEAWEKFAALKMGSGDALFLRTGRFARRAALGPWPAAQQAAGFHVSVIPWFKKRDIALISSDAVQDVQPSNIPGFPRPIHMLSINTLGMPMIDVADLEESRSWRRA